MVFSKSYSSFSLWLASRAGKPAAYTHRISAYVAKHPQATLKEARGHPSPFAFRTSFVLKLPVKGRWKVIRRSVTRLTPIDTRSELEKFLNHAGKVLKSQAYAHEKKALVGIEDNVEIPLGADDKLGTDTDDYDEGAT